MEEPRRQSRPKTPAQSSHRGRNKTVAGRLWDLAEVMHRRRNGLAPEFATED